MKAKNVCLLVAGTVVFSSFASMKLAAKDLESDTIKQEGGKQESKVELKEKTSKDRPHMDLAFCIDTTGSMQNEIDMVKTKVKDLVAKLCAGKPAPIVRVGLVAFRDRGDEYVTKIYPFTDDVDKFVKDISELKAFGGGDGPEAVNEALHASVRDLDWDKSNKTAKLLFLIGDATPKVYPDDYKWDDEAKFAVGHGIQINTIGCHGLENYGDGVQVFSEIAKLADGKFERLSYRQIVRDRRGEEKTLVTSGGTTYEVSSAARGDWKKGATELAKAGKAKSVNRAYLLSGGSASGGMTAVSGVSHARFAAAAPMSASAGAGMAGDSYYAAGGVSRKDSNLDSVMYDAAMKRASEKLKVNYSK